MSETKYLPFQSGMPAPAKSADPIDLTSVPAVQQFLTNTPFTSKSVIYLPGGTVNYLYRIHLSAPFKNNETVILKHAQPFMKDTMEAIDLDRQRFEVEAMTRVRLALPPTPPIIVPEIYHFDAHNGVIIMEDCGSDAVDLEEFLCSDSAASPGVAEDIGRALGEFIGKMHEWSRSNPDGVLDFFDQNLPAKKASADFYYDRIAATLQKTDTDNLPVLAELEVDAFDIRVISEYMDEYRSMWPLPRIPGRDVFLMGDLWFSNLVVSTSQKPYSLFILDWELARTGLAGAEVGIFCAAMEFLIQGSKAASERASKVLQSFIEAYSTVSNRDARLAPDLLSHWGSYFVFWAPRNPPGQSDEEIVRGLVREGAKLLAQSRDHEFLRKSPAKALLPN